MSIIHDALKKVQKSMQKNPDTSTPTTSSEGFIETLSSPESQQKSSSAQWIPTLVLVTLAVGGAFLYLRMQKNHQPKHLAEIVTAAPVKVAPPKVVSTPVPTPPASTTPAPVAPTPAAKPKPVLNIQGVMAQGSKNVALINDGIYEEGSVVEGQKILKISLNAITVEHDGHQEIIPIKK
jgi:hypothetical protein